MFYFPSVSLYLTDIPQQTLRIHVFSQIIYLVHTVRKFIALSWNGGGGGRISNLNSVHLRLTAASWKKKYSCYSSFFTNFELIFWTCLIGFGAKFHRSRNLPTTFLKCFNKVERWKYAGKEVRLNRVSNSQPPGHESDTLTTEPPWWGQKGFGINAVSLYGKKSFQGRPPSVLSVL